MHPMEVVMNAIFRTPALCSPFLVAVLLSAACAPESVDAPPPVDAAEDALVMLDLNGEARDVETLALERSLDTLRWAVAVDGERFEVQVEGETLAVTDASDRVLLDITRVGERYELAAWTGGSALRAGFEAQAPGAALLSPALAEVDGALSFPPNDDTARFFGPAVDAGNVVAPALALVALPARLAQLDADRLLDDGLAQKAQAMDPLSVFLGSAALGVALGTAYCMRSSTTASCDLGNGTGVSITCNACQGTASCSRTVSSGGGLRVLQAEDSGDSGSGGTGTVTCTCSCN